MSMRRPPVPLLTTGSRSRADEANRLILDPDQFYILASKEAVHVPPTHAAEMVPFNPLVGEFRVHYAGFMDPGFGHAPAGGAGARVVLEVRSHKVPFILEDGQIVGRLIYERMSDVPELLYGTGLGSHYQAQGLKLSVEAPAAAFAPSPGHRSWRSKDRGCFQLDQKVLCTSPLRSPCCWLRSSSLKTFSGSTSRTTV